MMSFRIPPKPADFTLLRQAFDSTLKELTPVQPRKAELWEVIHAIFEQGSSSTKSRHRIAELLAPETQWPSYERRIAELRESGDLPRKFPGIPELFAQRIVMQVHQLRRRREFAMRSKMCLAWEFITVQNPRTPLECRQKHDQMRPIGDVFFDDGPPCWRPDCSCGIRAVNVYTLRRLGIDESIFS